MLKNKSAVCDASKRKSVFDTAQGRMKKVVSRADPPRPKSNKIREILVKCLSRHLLMLVEGKLKFYCHRVSHEESSRRK